ncbi:hypothetical protein AYJ54_25560 [Bradyrhizobium centrolobii]|uniref:Uncharacterized protein n=1 Tax=Bradyrhizobium centrolobii TaxID=1505087 RepID=A0A176YDM4_9BRAD|nr:hypothetical protein AYJ54_25560 [Bradyrhizobium centrolobii]
MAAAVSMAEALREEDSGAVLEAPDSREAAPWQLVAFAAAVWSRAPAGAVHGAVDGAQAGAEAGLGGPAGAVAGADGDGAGRLRPASPLVSPPAPGTTAMTSACSGTASPG